MKNNFKLKIIITFFIIVLWFILLIIRSLQLQVFKKDTLVGKAKKQIVRDSVIYPNRGQIFDSNGFPLAINVSRYSIFTVPRFIKNKRKFIKEISKLIPSLKKNVIDNILKRKNYTWIARKIELSETQFEKLKKIKNVYINIVPKRIYPNNNFASQIIGFVGTDNKGLSGLEFKFDDILHGSPKRIRYIKDAKGRLVKFSIDKEGQRGKSLNLTIDKEIQFIAEKYLKKGVMKYNADFGGIGIMDVKTGRILGMANYPSFNPNEIKAKDKQFWQSSFIVTPFEPGSIFKTLTIASALEHKIVTPETGYYCEQGNYLVGNHVITEAESDHGQGWLSVRDILIYSSNIGTTKIAFDLKWDKLQSTLSKFKIGSKTGVMLPGESRGILNKTNISPLRLSNISFGQGVATTGIQMLAAYSAIANNGVWNRPLILKDEQVESTRIISTNTAKTITQMLHDVVRTGTGKLAHVPGFQIVGKTGTAQRSVNGKYKGYISSFIGYPINIKNPFVVFVYIGNPKKIYYGNLVAAPIFKKVVSYMLLKNKHINHSLRSNSDISKNLNNVNTKMRRLIYKKGLVPNFKGFDKKSIQIFANKYRIKIKLIGSGIAYKQSEVFNSKLVKNKILSIFFKVPSYD